MDQITEVIVFYGYLSQPGAPTDKDDWQALYCKKQGLENPWDYFHGGDVDAFKRKFSRQIDTFFDKYFEAGEMYPITHRIYGNADAKDYGEIFALTDTLKVSREWNLIPEAGIMNMDYDEAKQMFLDWQLATGINLDGFNELGWYAVADVY